MSGYEIIGKEEQKAVNDLFADGGVLFRHGFDALRKGKYHVLDLQKQFAKYLGTKYALATTSGTTALKVALKVMGVGPGDEVITSCFTFVATVDAILDCGAKPVLVNIDQTLGLDPKEVEKAITKRTKVILPVHMLGVAANIDEIVALARKHKLLVLEDNAEALGAKWGKKMLGTSGNASITSLDFGKQATCGEGGIVFTNDRKLFDLASEYHDHGHMNNPKFPRGRDTHRIYGGNYRLTEIQAVIARVQLRKLPGEIGINRKNYFYFQKALARFPDIIWRPIPKKCTPSFDTLIFYLPDKKKADMFAAAMAKEGLGTKNIPSAMEWHFAGYWDHMAKVLGFSTKGLLWKKFLPSYALLSRSIALPIAVSPTKQELKNTAIKLQKIAKIVLSSK